MRARTALPLVATWWVVCFIAVIAGLAPWHQARAEPIERRADIELFWREGCPRCEEAKLWLLELHRDHPGYPLPRQMLLPTPRDVPDFGASRSGVTCPV